MSEGTGDITVEKTGAGGLAFEVILAPAASEEGPRPPSPTTKEKRESLSQADIERKLKEAEERRLAAEANKLSLIAKEKERAAEANQRIQEQVDVFAKETEKKISEKMESAQENREAQLKALQDKLQEHERHIQEVQKKKLTQTLSGEQEADTTQ